MMRDSPPVVVAEDDNQPISTSLFDNTDDIESKLLVSEVGRDLATPPTTVDTTCHDTYAYTTLQSWEEYISHQYTNQQANLCQGSTSYTGNHHDPMKCSS